MKIIKKQLHLFFLLTLLAALLCGCGEKREAAKTNIGTEETVKAGNEAEAAREPVSGITSEDDEKQAMTEITELTPDPVTTTIPIGTREKQPGHYKINPYLVPEIQTELCGQDMTDTYKNFIDAVLNGENSYV